MLLTNIYVYGTQQINTATAVHFVIIYYLFIRRFHFNNEGRHYDCARFDSEQWSARFKRVCSAPLLFILFVAWCIFAFAFAFFFLFWLLHNAIQKHTRKDKRSYSLSKRIKCMHVDIAACSMETRMNVVSLCYDCCMNLLIYYVKYWNGYRIDSCVEHMLCCGTHYHNNVVNIIFMSKWMVNPKLPWGNRIGQIDWYNNGDKSKKWFLQ